MAAKPGLHPSNIHDNAYEVGSIDFTRQAIILGPDGPSLGGFVCPAFFARDELWKVGTAQARRQRALRAGAPHEPGCCPTIVRAPELGAAIVGRNDDGPIRWCTGAPGRQSLGRYGSMELDIALRLRVHVLAQALQAESSPA